MLSVALSLGSPRVAVSHHPALRCPDVPRDSLLSHATAWPTHPLHKDRVSGVLLLLPPSEGKTAPTAGDPVDLEALCYPELAAHRRRMGATLARISAQKNALQVLGVGESLASAVRANTHIWDAPSAPAHTVYTGVLFDAAQAGTWSGDALTRADTRVRIFSALWGALRPSDAIPAYRMSMGTRLPRTGLPGPLWVHHLRPRLDADAGTGLVVDCRSNDYVSAWRPAPPATWVSVRVERDDEGKRTVVSHMAKHTRGLLAAHLAAAPEAPATADELCDMARDLPEEQVLTAELGPRPEKGPQELTMVVEG